MAMSGTVMEERVSQAIHWALKQLNIISEANFPQIQVRAYHFINIDDFDKTFHLCIPLKQSKRLCYQTRDIWAYTYVLKQLNKANNLARSGYIIRASRLFYNAIKYFIQRSERTYMEERVSPYTFAIKILKSQEVVE